MPGGPCAQLGEPRGPPVTQRGAGSGSSRPRRVFALVPAPFRYKGSPPPAPLQHAPSTPSPSFAQQSPDPSLQFSSPWIPTAPAPRVNPARVPAPANAKIASAPPARRAAAPAAPWAVPSVPRAASAKGLRTSAAAVPEGGESLLPGVNRTTCTNLHIFFLIQPDPFVTSLFFCFFFVL